MLQRALQYDKYGLAQICQDHQVRRLDLFGSRAKGTAGDRSDMDLLVEFEPGHTPGLLGFLTLQEELDQGHAIFTVAPGATGFELELGDAELFSDAKRTVPLGI